MTATKKKKNNETSYICDYYILCLCKRSCLNKKNQFGHETKEYRFYTVRLLRIYKIVFIFSSKPPNII